MMWSALLAPGSLARANATPLDHHPFSDRAYTAIGRAADAKGISVSQYVREAALIRAKLHELDDQQAALSTAHHLLALAREVRRLSSTYES